MYMYIYYLTQHTKTDSKRMGKAANGGTIKKKELPEL